MAYDLNTFPPMTIRELHKRLGEIIQEHERRGFVDATMAFEQEDKTPTGRVRKVNTYGVQVVSSTLHGNIREPGKVMMTTALIGTRKG